MTAVELLLKREEQASGVVESTFDNTFFAVTADSGERESPTIFAHAGSISNHTAISVRAVSVSQATAETGSESRSSRVDACSAADFTEGERRSV